MLAKFLSTALLLAASAQPSTAARPDGASICDYYAQEKWGNNTKESQLKLMSSIVSYAYAGGDGLKPKLDNSWGIFNVGLKDGKTVYLRDYFNGQMNTTNLNDVATKTNWLDGGGVDPLLSFINGTTDSPQITPGSNQDTLFSHWYVAFGRVYGCSKVEDFLDKKYKTLMPAYVHKYMGLNSAQIGYFIQQITTASKYYGFSDDDASALDTYMNARYNTKCSLVDKNMLNSICMADEGCTYAQPKSDCEPYKNLKPYGVDDSATTSVAGGSSPTTAPSTSASPKTDKSSSLGGGAIAGIVIGALAGIVLIAGACLFFFKKGQKKNAAHRPESIAVSHATGGGGGGYYDQGSMGSPQMSQSHYDMSRQSQYTYFPPSGHDSYMHPSHSPPPQGWTDMQPQELHAVELSSNPASPTQEHMPISPLYKADVGTLVEIDSPQPNSWGGQTPQPQEHEHEHTAHGTPEQPKTAQHGTDAAK